MIINQFGFDAFLRRPSSRATDEARCEQLVVRLGTYGGGLKVPTNRDALISNLEVCNFKELLHRNTQSYFDIYIYIYIYTYIYIKQNKRKYII